MFALQAVLPLYSYYSHHILIRTYLQGDKPRSKPPSRAPSAKLTAMDKTTPSIPATANESLHGKTLGLTVPGAADGRADVVI